MSLEEFKTCVKCGGKMNTTSPPNSSPWTAVCEKCGHQEWAEVNIPPPWAPTELEYKRVLIEREKEKPTADEIQALRKLSPGLKEIPAEKALKEIEKNLIFDLGIHSVNEADALFTEAVELGLKPRLEEVESDTPSEKTSKEQCTWNSTKTEPDGKCSVCGKPGWVQVLPNSPASDCFCEEHAPKGGFNPFCCLPLLLLLIGLGVALYFLVIRPYF